MVSSYFSYDKGKAVQALRYHFINRKEIKILLVIVNVFAILSAVLFAMKLVKHFPFLISSMLWFILMLLFWYLLALAIYKKTPSFKARFRACLIYTYRWL